MPPSYQKKYSYAHLGTRDHAGRVSIRVACVSYMCNIVLQTATYLALRPLQSRTIQHPSLPPPNRTLFALSPGPHLS